MNAAIEIGPVKLFTYKNTFLKRFLSRRTAVFGLAILGVEMLTFSLGPSLFHLDPYSVTATFNMSPCPGHLLGTDEVGRDLFARLIYGGGVSLFIGVIATFIGIVVGLPLGLISGYYRGKAEAVVMRLADMFQSVPETILVLVLVTAFRPSVLSLTVIIGVMSWPSSAKLIYGNVLSEREREYVEAAKTQGVGSIEILFRYILPNVISPLWMTIAFHCARAILTESALSFLGAGIQPPQASLGNLLYAAQNLVVLTARPWMWVPPGLCLVLTIVSINSIGEGIRFALDIKS